VATNDELIVFVRDALARGTPRTQVEEVLLRTGWSRDQVTSALGAYADVEFPIPVPRPKPYLSAREAFMYLLLFSMLYLSAYNLGVLVFGHINRAFPDAAAPSYHEYARQAIRWALAALIVSFPVFVYLTVLVERSVHYDPAKRRSNVRRWLMYLTIFAAACVLIGDFITLVYNALGGELTTRFLLKVAAIAVIAGAIFGYYLSDLRLEDTKPVAEDTRWKRTIGGFAVAAVVAVVVSAFLLTDSPAEERVRRIDARRAEQLRDISESVNLYTTRHKRLPATLEELSSEGGMMVEALDPDGRAYEYRVTGGRTYELCGTFQRGSNGQSRTQSGHFWTHGPGRQCFQLETKEIR
jgi:hypothetical protein